MAVAAVKVVFEKVEAVPKLIRDAHHREYIPAEILGTGGFASCWRTQMLDGKEELEAQECALKAVKATLPKNLTQRFKLELAIQSKVHHPNLVEFYRAFTVLDTTYVALELCPNGSLTDMIKKRKFLTMGEIRRIMIQLCGAVKYLHQRDVVHRDIKAGNIFLDEEMNVKLGDFGLAAVMEPALDSTSTHARRTTFCGTPNYLAPEILDKSGGGHGMSVDIWSIGILAYFLAVGKAPFHAKSKEEIYKKLRKGDYGWPEMTPDSNEIPDDLRGLVAKLLVEEARRPTPDKIVRHPFFSQGFIPSRLDPLCRTRRPRWARVGTPEQNARTYKRLCWESQVGGVVHMGQPIPTKPASLVNELAEEIAHGRGITIPLREGLVYRGKAQRRQDQVIFEDGEAQPTSVVSPRPTKVLGERAVNITSPRPKLESKRSEQDADCLDLKAMKDSIDELQDRRAAAGTPPDPLGPIRGDSPRVLKTQNYQMNTPRKVAVSRPAREVRASPKKVVSTEVPNTRESSAQPRAQQPQHVRAEPLQLPAAAAARPIIDLTQSPPIKPKSTLRIARQKRAMPQAESIPAVPAQTEQTQQVLILHTQQAPPMPEARRMPSSLRVARTVSGQASGRSTPLVPDEPATRSVTPALETQTLGRIRRPKVASRTTSATSTSPGAALAAAAAATAVKTSPQAVQKMQDLLQAEIPPSPQRQVSATRPLPTKRSTSRAVSAIRDYIQPSMPKSSLEAAISEAAPAALAAGTIRRAPRRPRAVAAQGAEGLLLEALSSGERNAPPVPTMSREVNAIATLPRRPRRAGVCYD